MKLTVGQLQENHVVESEFYVPDYRLLYGRKKKNTEKMLIKSICPVATPAECILTLTRIRATNMVQHHRQAYVDQR